MCVVYVAGPYRGPNPWAVEQNIRLAEEVAFTVAQAGCTPLCPHSMFRYFDKTLPDAFWLTATLELLDRCDVVLMVPGWRRSEGACDERKRAEEKGLPVFGSVEELRAWRKQQKKT